MKKMWIGIAAAALVAYLVVSTLFAAGSFKTIHPHAEVTLTTMYTEMPGPEDMDLDRDSGLLFISSTDRWKHMRGEKSDDGIYLLALNGDERPHKLPTTFMGEFHPHGISVLKSGADTYLFVVNHNTMGSEVLLFEYRADTIFHKRSFSSPDLCCPNDVVGVYVGDSVVKFYVTNDHESTGGIARTFEDYLRIPLSGLMYWGGIL